MKKLYQSKVSADILVRDLQELYSSETGLLAIITLELLQSAAAIRDKLERVILINEKEATK